MYTYKYCTMSNFQPNNVHDELKSDSITEEVTQEEKENELVLSILAYVGPLVVVSYAFSKQTTVLFHVKQGTVLLGFYFVLMILMTIVNNLLGGIFGTLLFTSTNLAYLLFAGFGIRNAIHKKTLPLPVIGKYHTFLSFNK